jgi:hypothetical protein
MGESSTTIVENMKRWAHSVEAGVTKPDSDKVPDAYKLPDDFDFEQAKPEFKLIVFKKTLEEIFRILYEHDDYEIFPPASLSRIKRGLIDTRKGFYALLGLRIPKEVDTKIKEVLPLVRQAESIALEASTLLDEKGKRREYYQAISDCYDEMFQIKELLKTWKDKKDTK